MTGYWRSVSGKFMALLLPVLLSVVLAACGGAAPAAPTTSDAPASGTTAEQPAAPAAGLKEVARNRTYIFMGGGRAGQFTDHELWNPYAIGSSHQYGPNLIYEPLAFYSAFADKEYLWLAESYEYNEDFTALTIKTRSGIEWSDGTPFSAEDVAFTFTKLKELGSLVNWGVDIQNAVDTAVATDANTVEIKFNQPSPRFFAFVTYKYDIGVYIVPKHIFENEDWTTFKAFDIEKGWPITTGPFTLVAASPEQKIYDRRDTWWAADQGLAPMPEIERVVDLPNPPEQQSIQAFINNEIDASFTLAPESFKTIFAGNPNVTTHSGQEPPYGYLDWWPVSLYINTSVAPFDNPDVRWALSYFIDRQQVVDVGWSGANTISQLPMPPYPPLQRYFDAVQPLLQEYNTSEFNPEKGTALLEKAGFTKNGEGKWLKPDGTPFTFEVLFFDFLSGMALVITEQLKNQGIDVVPNAPPDAFDRFSSGNYQGAFFGHGGSVRDPYETLRLYQSNSEAVPGGHQVNFSKWDNPEYDKIVDQVYLTPTDDYEKLEELFTQAMEIWLPALPDIPLTELYHRIGYNQTYWTNWPTAENAYINGASWHLTHLMILWNLKAVEQ